MFRLAARNFAARNLAVARSSVAAPRVAFAARNWTAPRAYSAAAGLSKEEISTRVLDVLKGFEKVDRSKACSVLLVAALCHLEMLTRVPEQLTPTAAFAEDLGLDSLDAVEVVMAVEEVRITCFSCQSSSCSSSSRSSL